MKLIALSFATIFLLMRTVGTGTRVLNFLIDSFLICIISFAINRGVTFYTVYYGTYYFPLYYTLPLVAFLYYLIFESIWKRTPGKWMSLSKVVNRQGNKPSFLQITVRSAVRILSFIIIDSICLSFLDKTLHDFISKTEVIEI